MELELILIAGILLLEDWQTTVICRVSFDFSETYHSSGKVLYTFSIFLTSATMLQLVAGKSLYYPGVRGLGYNVLYHL